MPTQPAASYWLEPIVVYGRRMTRGEAAAAFQAAGKSAQYVATFMNEAADANFGYDDDQPRDDHGRWTHAAGSASKVADGFGGFPGAHEMAAEALGGLKGAGLQIVKGGSDHADGAKDAITSSLHGIGMKGGVAGHLADEALSNLHAAGYHVQSVGKKGAVVPAAPAAAPAPAPAAPAPAAKPADEPAPKAKKGKKAEAKASPEAPPPNTEGKNLPTIHMPSGTALMPDNKLWTNRFEIHSETSNHVYTVAQNKAKQYWGCSCPGWKYHRKCKHLTSLGLPNHEEPFPVKRLVAG